MHGNAAVLTSKPACQTQQADPQNQNAQQTLPKAAQAIDCHRVYSVEFQRTHDREWPDT